MNRTDRKIEKNNGSAVVWVFGECLLFVAMALFAVPSCRHTGVAIEPRTVSIPTDDGGLVYADLYGEGKRAVVLAPGGRFRKVSWTRQAQLLAGDGFRVAAIDFRGHGQSMLPEGATNPYEGCHRDVLAVVRYLRQNGAETVSVVGASFGGWAAAGAVVAAEPGEIQRVVFLSASSIDEPERLKARKLFVSTRDDTIGDGDPRLPLIEKLFERAPEPKEFLLLDGSAHAQHIFDTPHGEQLMNAIRQFLSEP